MKLRFWGTRGSIPVSMVASQLRSRLIQVLQQSKGLDTSDLSVVERFVDALPFEQRGTYGGHSSCVQIEHDGGDHVILDMGSGARPLAENMLGRFGPAKPQTYHVFMSHFHWDHIMGFPFFTPVYIPGNRIIMYTCHPGGELAMRRQQGAPSFPVGFEQLAATIEFRVLEAERDYEIAGMRVRALRQRHAGGSYGWRFERAGKVAVYSTDSEHRVEDLSERELFIEFFQAADAVVFDAMYSLADAISVKADWGHSSNIMGVELCQAAHAKRLVMFHHEPSFDDARIAQVLRETRRFEEITRDGVDGHVLEVLTAWDGLEIEL